MLGRLHRKNIVAVPEQKFAVVYRVVRLFVKAKVDRRRASRDFREQLSVNAEFFADSLSAKESETSQNISIKLYAHGLSVLLLVYVHHADFCGHIVVLVTVLQLYVFQLNRERNLENTVPDFLERLHSERRLLLVLVAGKSTHKGIDYRGILFHVPVKVYVVQDQLGECVVYVQLQKFFYVERKRNVPDLENLVPALLVVYHHAVKMHARKD